MQHEHKEMHFAGAEWITDIVIGMSDGLTVPFALAAGMSGALQNSKLVVIAGLAEIAAGSIAMGLGGYLAGKTNVEHYTSELKREWWEVNHLPEKEAEEVKEIFAEMGLTEATQNLVVAELTTNKEKWVDFMMRFELGLEKPHPRRALKSAFNIGVSYIAGGIVPLLPYIFIPQPTTALQYSCLFTLLCLGIFGYFKARLTGQPPLQGAFRIMLTGTLAAGAAYCLAKVLTG